MVSPSAKACRGCAVALSILMMGIVAYSANFRRTCSSSSRFLSVKEANARIATKSQYWDTTCAASFTCSDRSPLMIVSFSYSIAQASLLKFITITSKPRFLAAFWVLSRVRKLGLKNNKPIVFRCPKCTFAKGSSLQLLASAMVFFRSTKSCKVIKFFISDMRLRQ